jgi:hypothetical protein
MKISWTYFTARGGKLVYLVFMVYLVHLVGERNKPDKPNKPERPPQLSPFFRAGLTGLPQRAIHLLVDREEIPLSWVRLNFLLEHGADLMRRYAGHTGIDPGKVSPVLSIGEGKVESINDTDGVGLLFPFA